MHFEPSNSHSPSVQLTRVALLFFSSCLDISTEHSSNSFFFFSASYIGTSFIRWNLQIDSVMPMRLLLLPSDGLVFDCNQCWCCCCWCCAIVIDILRRRFRFPIQIPIYTKLSPLPHQCLFRFWLFYVTANAKANAVQLQNEFY